MLLKSQKALHYVPVRTQRSRFQQGTTGNNTQQRTNRLISPIKVFDTVRPCRGRCISTVLVTRRDVAVMRLVVLVPVSLQPLPVLVLRHLLNALLPDRTHAPPPLRNNLAQWQFYNSFSPCPLQAHDNILHNALIDHCLHSHPILVRESADCGRVQRR